MKIFVCIKQVPDTETKIKIGADKASIDSTGVKWVVNPYDEFAIEEAVKQKEANVGSTVTVFCLGPKKRTADAARTALAMGADEGVLIDAPETVDAFTTAKALASAIKAEGGCDLLLTGKLAIDDNQSAVSQMVAEFLNIPHTGVVAKMTVAGNKVTAEREVEGGTKEVVEMTGPSLIAANKGLNMPRYASLPGIMKAKKKILKELDLVGLGIAADSQKTKFINMSLPPEKPPVKILQGENAQKVSELVRLLRDEAKVL
ncbi:MAG: electron transfer flavoprotein beta subunit/FixA family protein [Pseudobdellovibrionaceae bacterium]